MAYVLAPDGTPGEVPDEQLQEALAQGFQQRAPTPDEQARVAAGEQTLAAGGEAILRGVSMGLSDPLLVKAASAYTGRSEAELAKEMKLRKEENPLAAGVGEIGGAVGSMFVGPAALVAKGVGGLRAGGLAAKAAAGAIEGGAWGLGSVVSEAALEDSELTAEKMAAGMAAGALTGGALDVVGHGVGKATSALVRKFGGTSIKNTLEELAFQAESRQILEASGQAEARLMARGGSMRDVVRIGREEGIIDATAGMNKATAQKVDDVMARFGNDQAATISQLDTALPLTDITRRAQLVGDMETRLRSSFANRYAAQADVDAFVKEYLAPVASDAGASWTKLMSLQSDIRKRVGPFENTMKKEVYSAGRKLIRNTVFDEAAVLAPEMPNKLADLQKRYAALAFLEDVVSKRASRLEATGGALSLGLGGMLSAAAGAGIGGAPGAIAGAVAMKAYRERGGFLIGGALRALADSNATSLVGNALLRRVQQALAVAPEMLGGFRGVLESAAAQGPEALLETHVQLASSPQGDQYLSSLGMEPDSMEQVASMGTRLSYLSAAQRVAQEYDASLAQAADGMLGVAKGRPASFSPPTLTNKEFSKFSEGLQTLLRDPESAFTRIPSEQLGAIPTVSGMTAATIMRGAQFLDSKTPKSPYAGMPESVAPKWEPSQVDLDRYARYREAVMSPEKVLRNMANGYLSPEQVEAVRAVYPRLYGDLQQQLAERLSAIKRPLTYQQKLSLSLLMGPTALAMSPQQVQLLQQAQGGAGGQQGGMKKPDGRQTVDAQKNLMTQGQRLESRG